MSDIPHYFLYGEAAPSNALTYLHIASLQESLPKHNWQISPHRHENLHQLLIVENGSVLTQINDKYRRENGPCILSIPPKEVHGFVHQPNVQGYIITIERAFLLNLFTDTEREELHYLFHTPVITRPQPDSNTAWTMEHLTPYLLDEYQHTQTNQSAMIGAYLKIFFILLQRSTDRTLPAASQQDERIIHYERFMGLLENHYLEHWTVGQYANALGMSISSLNRQCKHYSGQKTLKVIHQRLLTEIKRQLIYTQLSAQEISFKLGFKDPGYFSRFFSRNMAMTPGKFRQQIREQRQLK